VNFANAPMLDIIAYVKGELANGATSIWIDVLDPEVGTGRYPGERVEHLGRSYIHRSFRIWVDLAERLGLRFTPRWVVMPFMRLTFEPLHASARLQANADDPTERYGVGSEFARVSKLEDPGFVVDMSEAIARVDPQPGARVLDLGVNTGDELELLRTLSPTLRDATLVGVDHSVSAIERARERFGGCPNVQLHVADLSTLGALELGCFDLVVSIGTLQSPGIDDREVIRQIVQHHLTPDGAVIIGFPNCRYIDGEIEYGTRMKNFTQPELGLLIKDVAFYRKYLQQHHKQVFVTGKNYILVTGVANREPTAS
jgi:trans-aconitate methyltransferase